MLELDNLCLHCMGQLDHPDELCPHCGANPTKTSNAPNQLECGSILAGTYLVGCVLGQGGFGITYIGLDLNLNLKVAIKEYYPEGYVTREGQTRATVMPLPGERKTLFERGKERFVSEAKTLAKFGDDPSIVGVRTFFYENGTAYIVMNFVEGVTLKEFAAKRGGKLPAREVLAMMEPLFVSLSKVHAAGLLHRDISPDNIMRKKNGSLVLLDFGAARQMSVDGEHSNTINVKHGFAPEEQYRTHGEQGPWTDVYALCATIYRLTTGVTPQQALDRMANDEPLAPPSAYGADLTRQQEAALLHGLAIRADQRTRSIEKLEGELNESPDVANGSIPSKANSIDWKTTTPDKNKQIAKKQKKKSKLKAVVLVAGTIALGFWAYIGIRMVSLQAGKDKRIDTGLSVSTISATATIEQIVTVQPSDDSVEPAITPTPKSVETVRLNIAEDIWGLSSAEGIVTVTGTTTPGAIITATSPSAEISFNQAIVSDTGTFSMEINISKVGAYDINLVASKQDYIEASDSIIVERPPMVSPRTFALDAIELLPNYEKILDGTISSGDFLFYGQITEIIATEPITIFRAMLSDLGEVIVANRSAKTTINSSDLNETKQIAGTLIGYYTDGVTPYIWGWFVWNDKFK